MPGTDSEAARPVGKSAVKKALIEATIDLIVETGTHVSVRTIAARAGVNHGLVHIYFGSKDDLLSAALDEMNQSAASKLDADGFPPPDLGSLNNGEFAKAIARTRLDDDTDQFSSHPVISKWRSALVRTRPDLGEDEIDLMVASASALGLGWGIYSGHLCEILGLGPESKAEIHKRIGDLVAELGGIPAR